MYHHLKGHFNGVWPQLISPLALRRWKSLSINGNTEHGSELQNAENN